MWDSLRPGPSALLAVWSIFVPLLAGTPLPAWAANSAQPVFNIVDYGAKRDASALATDAFRQAIQAAKAAGGGTIYVPPGKYASGPIELFSNMILDVDAGATIAFPVAPLPFAPSRQLGVETLAPMPLIGGRDVENVTVTGHGILTTGNYEDWRKAYPEAYQDLAIGRIDYIVNGQINLLTVVAQKSDVFEMGTEPVSGPSFVAWPVKKGNKEALDFLNGFIRKMRDSGKLAELQKKWLGVEFKNLPEHVDPTF